MSYYLRVVGRLLVGMGVVFGGVTAFSMLGAFPLEIDVFGRQVEDARERCVLLIVCGSVALVGLVMVMLARRRAGREAREAA